MFTLRDIIGLAVQIERNGEILYRNAAREVSDSSISRLLVRLADEEVEHAKWFSELNDRVGKTVDDADVEATAQRILQGILGDESFSLKDVNFSSMTGIEDLLKVAINFEKDTVLFYEMILSVIDDKETRNHLNAIIEEENYHIRLLQESLKRAGAEEK